MLPRIFLAYLVALTLIFTSSAFSVNQYVGHRASIGLYSSNDSNSNNDSDEFIACRITVVGDVQGGYVRSCIINEAGRFRRLVGTMSPPSDGNEAEIYVEGKRKMIDGFIRWCRRSKLGLNQKMEVKTVVEEDPTGLYEEFYVKTH